jgi:hypothetical protein
MSEDDIPGAKYIQSNVEEEAGDVVESDIQPVEMLCKRSTEKAQTLVSDVEAMIGGKVRSLSKPRSG